MAELEQKITYKPTCKEKKLLDALSDPANRTKNVTEICAVAGISRTKYYYIMANPEFAAHYRELCFELIKNAAQPLVNSAIQAAHEGSHPHFKTLMEMAGLYMEKKALEHSGGITIEQALREIEG